MKKEETTKEDRRQITVQCRKCKRLYATKSYPRKYIVYCPMCSAEIEEEEQNQ